MRKILIAIPTLNSGGVEVSMIRFIKELSKNKDNEIVLLMLKKEGIYLKNIPNNIKIIEVDYNEQIYSYFNTIKDIEKVNGVINKIKFLIFRLRLKKYLKFGNYKKYYELFLKHVLPIKGKYDIAIDWHGYGHFITTVVASKVDAKKKAMWIHDEKNEWLTKIKNWNDNFDKIFCVGLSCMENVKENNCLFANKVDVFYNMTDYENVRKKSMDKVDFVFDKKNLNIITVGRLEWQKGYDIAINTALNLKKKKINFCWYVIGGGSLENELKELVKFNKLESNFKFLGIVKNPFPYVKQADLYVLTSRHEGYCLATLEAKILGKVIIATDIPSNREQIKDGINGYLCDLDSNSFSKKIIEVSKNKKNLQMIKRNLKAENFDYTSEFEKLYKLMEE